jgi:aminotransferase
VAVPVHEKDDFRLRADELEKRITSKSKVLLLNFPTNPTGATMPREALQEIADVCIKHDLIVLSDEIYAELTYDGAEHVSIASLPGMRERTVFLHGLSKGWAMTGFRIGYACAPKAIIEAMMKIHQYAILCAPIMAQDAAIEALEHGEPAVAHMREKYELRRNFIVSALNEMGLRCHLPHGAFYVFPEIRSTGLSSRDFAMRLLEEEKVAVVPGPAFGPSGEGFVRCSYATSLDQIKIAMERMASFVRRVSRRAA